MTPPTVNAYYDPQMNDINFPAGILQPPLFDPTSDAAPNYGNTGGTIGHELTHGFDDEGRQFDAQGNLRDWWTPDDEKEFVKRAACISDQYSTYTVDRRHQDQRQAHAGRRCRRLGRVDFGLHGVAAGYEGAGPEADRWADSRAAILRRLWAKLVLERARRNQADARHGRSALAGKISYQRSRFEYAAVPAGFSLQGGIADGE